MILGICSDRAYAWPPLLLSTHLLKWGILEEVVGTVKTGGIRERGGNNGQQLGRVQTEIYTNIDSFV
jgi:hypothetical protein